MVNEDVRQFEDWIRQAEDAIGEADAPDYKIRPTEHAEKLPKEAISLASILRSHEIAILAEEYEHADYAADRAQSVFRRTIGWSTKTLLMSGILGGSLLVVGSLESLFSEGLRGGLLLAIGVTGLIAGAVGTALLNFVQRRRLLARWMTQRAHAETLRSEYFSSILAASATAGNPQDIPLQSLKLEYLRRYHLEVQLAYYTLRGSEHQHAADRTALVAGAAAGLLALGSGLAGILGAFEPKLTAVASLSVLGTALATFAASNESSRQDDRNAERYQRTRASLVELRSRLNSVRDLCVRGDHAALSLYAEALDKVFSAEHRQWVADFEFRHSAVSELDTHLRQSPGAIRVASTGAEGPKAE